MTLYLLYTVAASLGVPAAIIAGWFLVRWLYRRRVKNRKARELNRLLEFDKRDCYTQNDKA